MKQVLITTGATVTFIKLIRYTLSPRFVNELYKLEFTDLVVQYGKSPDAETLVRSLLDKLSKVFTSKESIQSDTNGGLKLCIEYKDAVLTIKCIKFDRDLVQNYTSKSDLIISHAGTGSILDSLRLKKKLIILVNDKLQDNHQLQIAKAFEEKKVLRVASTDFDEFIRLVANSEHEEFSRLSEPNGSMVEDILLAESM